MEPSVRAPVLIFRRVPALLPSRGACGRPHFRRGKRARWGPEGDLFSLYSVIFNVLYTDGFAYDSTIPFTSSPFPVGGLKDLTCRSPSPEGDNPDRSVDYVAWPNIGSFFFCL